MISKFEGSFFNKRNFGEKFWRTHTGLESYSEGLEKEEILVA